jgi:hypothetical protein
MIGLQLRGWLRKRLKWLFNFQTDKTCFKWIYVTKIGYWQWIIVFTLSNGWVNVLKFRFFVCFSFCGGGGVGEVVHDVISVFAYFILGFELLIWHNHRNRCSFFHSRMFQSRAKCGFENVGWWLRRWFDDFCRVFRSLLPLLTTVRAS